MLTANRGALDRESWGRLFPVEKRVFGEDFVDSGPFESTFITVSQGSINIGNSTVDP